MACTSRIDLTFSVWMIGSTTHRSLPFTSLLIEQGCNISVHNKLAFQESVPREHRIFVVPLSLSDRRIDIAHKFLGEG
jgi:hypothetical protein